MKLAKVKSEAAFYKKFPTEEHFFKAHPMARYGYALANSGTPLLPDTTEKNDQSSNNNKPLLRKRPSEYMTPDIHRDLRFAPETDQTDINGSKKNPGNPPGTIPPINPAENIAVQPIQKNPSKFGQRAQQFGEWAGRNAGDMWAAGAQLANVLTPPTPVRQNINPYQMAINSNPMGTGSHAAYANGGKMKKGKKAADGIQMPYVNQFQPQQPLDWDRWNAFHANQYQNNPQYGTDALNHGNFNNAALDQWNQNNPTQAIPQSDIIRYQQEGANDPTVKKEFGPSANEGKVGKKTTGYSKMKYTDVQVNAQGTPYYTEEHGTHPLAANQVGAFTDRAHSSQKVSPQYPTKDPVVDMPERTGFNSPQASTVSQAQGLKATGFPTLEEAKAKARGKKIPSTGTPAPSYSVDAVRSGASEEAYTGTKMFPDSINRGKRNTYFDDPVKSIHMADGGPMDDDWRTGMMKSKMATADAMGNTAAHRMVQNYPQSYTFTGKEQAPSWSNEEMPPAGSIGTHYMASMGKYAVPLIQQKGKGLQYNSKASSKDKEAMKFNNEADAEYFAEHYKYVAPMMRATEQYANGGYMKMDAGGFSNTPIHVQGPAKYQSTDSIKLLGNRHSEEDANGETGQKIYANGTHVEAEGGEILANEPRTGTPHVLGNLRTLPETAMKLAEMGVKVGNNMKHKEVGEIIAKAEMKNDKMQTKVNYLLNTNQPGANYQGPSFNSGKVLADIYAQNKVKTDTAKQLVMDDMNMQNDIAEKMGMDPKKVGNYMKDAQKLSAKYGVKMAAGGPMNDKLSMVAPQSRQEYVEQVKYPTLLKRFTPWTKDDEQGLDDRGESIRALEGLHYSEPSSYPINPRTLTPQYPREYNIATKPQFTDVQSPQTSEEVYRTGGSLYQPLQITPAMPTQHSQITPVYDIAPMTMRKDWANDGSAGGKPRSYITKSPTTVPGDMIFAAKGAKVPAAQRDNTPLTAQDIAEFEDLRKSNPEMFTEDYGQGRKNAKLPGEGKLALWGPGYRNVKEHAGKYTQTPNPPDYMSVAYPPYIVPVGDDNPHITVPEVDWNKREKLNTQPGPDGSMMKVPNAELNKYTPAQRPTTHKGIRNRAGITDYLPEIMSAFDQIDPVQSLQARTNLEDTYSISFQNQKNDIQQAYGPAMKAAANNPGAQAAIAGEMAEKLKQVDAQELQYNQQNQGGIRGRNIERLDRRDAMNLQLDSQKLDRQAAAKEAHNERIFGAAQSVSSKEAQRRAQNWMLGADEKATGYIIQDKDGNYHRIAPDHEYAHDGPYGISSLANDKSTTETKSWKDPKTGETWKKVTKDDGNNYYGGKMMAGGGMGGFGGGQMAMRGPSYFGIGGADTKKKKKRKS